MSEPELVRGCERGTPGDRDLAGRLQHRAAAQRLNCLSHPRGQPRATSNGLEHFGEDGREGFAVVTWNDGMQVSIEILP